MKKLALFTIAWLTLSSTALGQANQLRYKPNLRQNSYLHQQSVLQFQSQLAVAEEMRRDRELQKKQFNQFMQFQREQAEQRAIQANREQIAKFGGYVGGAWVNPRYHGSNSDSQTVVSESKTKASVPEAKVNQRGAYIAGTYYNPNYRGK